MGDHGNSPQGSGGGAAPADSSVSGGCGSGTDDHRAAAGRIGAAAIGALMTGISAGPTRRAHLIYLAPLGLYSRYMLKAYFRQVLTVAAALMTIALTIDLWPQVPLLTGGPAHSVPATIGTIVRLAVLRIPDLLPPF